MNSELKEIIDKLNIEHSLSKSEWVLLFEHIENIDADYIAKLANATREKIYGKDIYIRGLIEFTNYCRNNCYYCGIRRDNRKLDRYRLSKDVILSTVEYGYNLGFRTFVLQGGEDGYYTPDLIADIVCSIKKLVPDCAVTLSFGEYEREVYELWKQAGADRYLLRHETANEEHYSRLHPDEMSLSNRRRCLYDLRDLGYQVGAGFMVGSPYQTSETLAEDMLFIERLRPQMIGIGPFISHHDTPFRDKENGSVETTIKLISLLRLLCPNALIPATTALGTLAVDGRERGILAGANVVMPNLSPKGVRDKYALYDGKLNTGEEAAECVGELIKRMESIGYSVAVDRGDYKE